MTTREKITANLYDLRSEKSEKKNFLKVIIGEIERSVEKNPNEDEVIKILKKLKNYAEINKNTFELEVLQDYLPEMLSESEIKTYVQSIIDENGFTLTREMGQIMKIVSTSTKANLIDKKVVSIYVKEVLN